MHATPYILESEAVSPSSSQLDLGVRVHRSLSRLDLRGVSIDVDGNIVTLTGSVPSFYMKQVAQEFARRVAGVVRVVNLVEVRRAAAPIPEFSQVAVPA